MKNCKKINVFFVILYTLVADPKSALTEEWPKIQPLEVTSGINFEGNKALLSIPFFDKGGKVRYRLVCRGVKEIYLDSLMDRLKINYLGPWMCVLNKGNRETEFTLLNAGGVAPWHGRGYFYDKQLIASCGNYPEYGRVRHFRLRGFILTLEFTDIDVRDDDVVYGVFKVLVKSDPSATSEYAEKPKYLDPFEPGRSCKNVLLRDKQRQ